MRGLEPRTTCREPAGRTSSAVRRRRSSSRPLSDVEEANERADAPVMFVGLAEETTRAPRRRRCGLTSPRAAILRARRPAACERSEAHRAPAPPWRRTPSPAGRRGPSPARRGCGCARSGCARGRARVRRRCGALRRGRPRRWQGERRGPEAGSSVVVVQDTEAMASVQSPGAREERAGRGSPRRAPP